MNEDFNDLLAAFALKCLFHSGAEGHALTASDIAGMLFQETGINSLASPDEFDSALESFHSNAWVSEYQFRYASTRYEITPDGVKTCQNAKDNFPTLYHYFKFGTIWLIESLQNVRNTELTFEPDIRSILLDETHTDEPSVDKWEPLPLDRNDPVLDQAIAKIEELAEAVEQDNGYAATEPDERAYILSALREGIRALKEQTVIFRMQFDAFVREPIERLTSRFGPSAIGLLAATAKELIKDGLKHAAEAWWNSR